MPALTTQIKDLATELSNFNPESKVTATVTAENTGELMDSAISLNCRIVQPFMDSAEQNYYYFLYEVKKNVIIKVKSSPKKLKG